MSRFVDILAAGQAIYFGVTGIWPLVSMRTFERVTGPKTDKWLVKTVALMIVAAAIALGVGAIRKNVSIELAVLAICSSAFLTIIDIVYSTKRVISKIYLCDAIAEIMLVVAWLACWKQWTQ